MTAESLAGELRTERRLPAPRMMRLIREMAGVSQARIARELGVDRVTVARWELGLRTPRGELRRRYVELLNTLRQDVDL